MFELVSKIYATIKSYNDRQQARDELYRMSDRALADIGISRCDIETVVKNLPESLTTKLDLKTFHKRTTHL